MTISRVLLNHAPGEVRAVAFGEDDLPARLFNQRWGGEGEAARLGDVLPARLRQKDEAAGGAFFQAADGQEFFVRQKLPPELTQGAETLLKVQAEIRQGKLARASLAPASASSEVSAFDQWRKTLPGEPVEPETATTPEEFDEIEQAFEQAEQSRVAMPRGGVIRMERTAALVSADIDTAGRVGKGSSAARALSTNRDAISTIARQLALRDWGGLVVIDCIAPLTTEARTQLRDAFIDSFKAISTRKVEALKPSRFGLLEAKIAWGATPVEDRLRGEDGTPTAETELLDLFRQAAREAASDRTAFFRLTLSPHALKAYIERRNQCDAILQRAFSGRVQIASGTGEQSVVRRA